jgi:hypothetical protein
MLMNIVIAREVIFRLLKHSNPTNAASNPKA